MSALLSEGSLFAGRYRVLRPIAAGGMGAVYEVVHVETNRRRALKIMHAHLFQSEDMRERFQREARITAELESEHFVDIFDAGVEMASGTPFFVMELLRGEELGKRLKLGSRFTPDETVTYLRQVALALDIAHEASIIHRDLKPDNLFLSRRADGTSIIKILDFGIAKVVADSATAGGVTRSMGTPIYMSPEQIEHGARLTGAADIYALGMIAYTMLVGGAYWSEEAKAAGGMLAFAVLVSKGPQEPPIARAHRHGVALPAGFDAWFARATARFPIDRFPTARAAIDTLQEALFAAPSTAVFSSTIPLGDPRPAPALLTTVPTPLAPAPPRANSVLSLSEQSTHLSIASPAAPDKPKRRGALGAIAACAVVLAALAVWRSLLPADSPRAHATEAPPPAPTPTSEVVAPPPIDAIPSAAPPSPEITALPLAPSGERNFTTLPPRPRKIVEPAPHPSASVSPPPPVPSAVSTQAPEPEKPAAEPQKPKSLFGQD